MYFWNDKKLKVTHSRLTHIYSGKIWMTEYTGIYTALKQNTVHIWVGGVHMSAGTQGGQKTAPDPLRLQLQAGLPSVLLAIFPVPELKFSSL